LPTETSSQALKHTPLTELHERLGAKMVPFAGYLMPVQYPAGILKEHLHTREKAGLFDVSHMGQAWIKGPDDQAAASALETLVPADLHALQPGQVRYTQLLNDDGGTIDDLMVSRSLMPGSEGWLYIVVNASRKDVDLATLKDRLPGGVTVEEWTDRALIALQGPAAERVLESSIPGIAELNFMHGAPFMFDGEQIYVTRSGYTGEDGFEISVSNDRAVALWEALSDNEDVEPVGLGARDSLRLEAGLCLYGHELDETVSPVEAGLAWSIQKRRREQGGFAGADRILRELKEGPSRKLAGIRPDGRAPAREGTEIRHEGEHAGVITSGGFGPSVGGPVALGFVKPELARPGQTLDLMVRGKALPATVVKLPFVKKSFKR
jgi:aminomethyltransferase